MASASLSQFLQSPASEAVFGCCPPRVSRLYIRVLGNLYLSKRPAERERSLRMLRLTLHSSRAGRNCDAAVERQVLHGVFDHYFEKLLTAYWGFERMRKFLLKIRMVHADTLDHSLALGRGVILSTAHFGAVEFLPAALSFRGYPVTMVVRFRTRKLKQTLMNLARRANLELLDVDEGGVLPKALGALRAGRIFITELDEMGSWKPAGDKVMNFFGRRVPLDRSVELLHRRTGAPVLLGLVERVGGLRYQLVVETPEEHHAAPIGLGPDALLLKRLEHYVYDAPDHWYIWKDLQHIEQLAPA